MAVVFGALVALFAILETARWLSRAAGRKLSLLSMSAQYAGCIWRSHRRDLFVAVLVSIFPMLAACWMLKLNSLLGILFWCLLVLNELLPPTYLLLGESDVTGHTLRKRFRWRLEKTADLLHSKSRLCRLLSLRNRSDQWQQQLVALAGVSLMIVVDVNDNPTPNVLREIIWVLGPLRHQTCFVGETKSQAIQEIVKGYPPLVLGKPPLVWITESSNLLADLHSAIPDIVSNDAASLRVQTGRWPYS